MSRTLQLDRHRDKRQPPDSVENQWSLRQALKLYQAGERQDSSRKRAAPAADDNSSLSSERSARSSNSGTSSSSAAADRFPTTNGVVLTQHRLAHDAQPAQRGAVRGQAEQHRDGSVAAAVLESNAGGGGGVKERSASSGSSRMSISSSDSQAQTPSATARATKRPGRNPAEVQRSAKKRLNDSSSKVVDDRRRNSPSISRPSRIAALDKTTAGTERRPVNDRDSLTAARPMDRYERVERYLERSNMLPPPTADVVQDIQRRRKRQKQPSRNSGLTNDPMRKAVMPTLPAKLRLGTRVQSDSENEFDNKKDDAKEDVGGKRHRRSDGRRSAKKRRQRQPTDRVKYSFPSFDKLDVPKKRKHRSKPGYESSSSGSSSSKDSESDNATPPPPVQQPSRKRADVVDQRRQLRGQALSQSSSEESSRSGHGRRRNAMVVARGGSVDSVMPTKKQKLHKSIERNAPMGAAERSPGVGDGRRGHVHGRSAAMPKLTEVKHDENANEVLTSETDKNQWRKYFADLYTFNMLQKAKSDKKKKKKRHRDDAGADNDDERQNAFHPAPPEALHGDTKATGFDGLGHPVTIAGSHPAASYDASHRVPFGKGPLMGVMPPDVPRGVPPPHDNDLAAYHSWSSAVAKPTVAPAVDEVSGRQTLLPLPSEPVPLFSLNLSGVMSSVSRRL